jgi:hypothetical protein
MRQPSIILGVFGSDLGDSGDARVLWPPNYQSLAGSIESILAEIRFQELQKKREKERNEKKSSNH